MFATKCPWREKAEGGKFLRLGEELGEINSKKKREVEKRTIQVKKTGRSLSGEIE